MKKTNLNILFFSTFPPRECGIATFTRDLSEAIRNVDPSTLRYHIALSDIKEGYNYPLDSKVTLEINQFCLEDYEKAAYYANNCGADIINIQHEFGIFGGFDGSFLIKFLEKVKIPKVITWHTMPLTKEAKRREKRIALLKKFASLCEANTNITESCRQFVIKQKIAPAKKTFYIPHGAPFFDLSKVKECKKKLKLENKIVLGTQGMVSENKGLEYVIEALPSLIKKYPHLIYLVIGTHHPRKPRHYYEKLQKLVEEKNLSKHVQFIDRYLPLEEVIEYLLAVDIHITPYLVPEQMSSGVLCYAVAAGKYCISTPFHYAQEVLANNRGVLVPFRNSEAIGKAIEEAIKNPSRLKEIQNRAYEYGQQFMWDKVAEKYLDLFSHLLRQ